MKTVALVAAHFVPSNLTAVHRSRLWTYYLKGFGWEPVIITTHPDYYEEPPAPGLLHLVPDDLRVIRTKALPTEPVRLVGSIGIRGFWGHYRALCDLAERDAIDFVHITIPSFYSALLGRLLYRRYGIPYGIDYIDPWVHDFPVPDVPLGRLKAWASTRVARTLEPWAVRDAALITGVAESYYESVLDRNAHLKEQAVTAAMPYGGTEYDHDALRANPRELFLWSEGDGLFHILYAGAMLPKAYPVLEVTLQALAQLKAEEPALVERFRLHFVGTGSSPDDPEGHNVQPLAQQYGVADLVTEHPHRISYLDVLSHLQVADAAYVMGTTERHYTPSKTYQAVLSRTPIWAMLHAESSATAIIRDSHTGTVVSFPDGSLPSVDEAAASLRHFLEEDAYDADRVEWSFFDDYSARASTRTLAHALDAAHARFHGEAPVESARAEAPA